MRILPFLSHTSIEKKGSLVYPQTVSMIQVLIECIYRFNRATGPTDESHRSDG